MVKVEICTTKDQIIDHFMIRKIVFVDEQKVTMEEEFDLVEKERIMFVMYDDAKPIGAARIYIQGNKAKIQRVCILKEYRFMGYGYSLMEELHQYCDAQAIKETYLDAQIHAIAFYEKCGYISYGELFYDARIPHYHMKRVKP
ncbi:MAG: GNAT family N-acetyltransferase [Bacilli bacterium]|jgi:predicted GNAT family N-acyltransferase|nr:GNAT family N-acetyltransferase [Bacilli bacterium]